MNEVTTKGKTNDIEQSNTLTDYNIYIMPRKEKVLYILVAAVILFGVGFVFYRHVVLAGLICPLALLYPKMRKKQIIEKRKYQLNLQFKDMLYALSSSLSAGKSVEGAFRDILRDLEIIYPDANTDIIKEIEYINRKIEMNETIELALEDFAQRSHLEDIQNFANVFFTCKRTGGNIVEIVRNTSNIISDKIEIRQEIDTMLAARKFEQKVLNIMPILMIIILSASAADYMEPVFKEVVGRVVMTVALGLFLAAYYISKKIMEINV